MTCPNCGKNVDENTAFCPYCSSFISSKREKNRSNAVVIISIVVCLVLAVAAVSVFAFNARNKGSSNIGMHEDYDKNTDNYYKKSDDNNTYIADDEYPKKEVAPKKEHTYEVVVSHVSWSSARDAAAAKGGHLVTLQDQEEFNKVITLLSESEYTSVKNVWIGACAPAGLTSQSAAKAYWGSGDAKWITNEPFNFYQWRSGEPSGYDAQLGSEERYLQIFRPKADGGVWSFNDAGDDLSEYKPNTLAYVIEYE